MESFVLPSGKLTYQENIYVREWRKLTNRVLKFFPGYQLKGFDPGIELYHSRGYKTDTLSLNMTAIRSLLSK